MKLSTLIVGGDTGFLHLAVALGKRVLMLMQYVGPGSAAPYGHTDWALVPRGDLPLSSISPEEVIQASAEAFPSHGTKISGK